MLFLVTVKVYRILILQNLNLTQLVYVLLLDIGKKVNWYPTHYVCIDSVVIKSNIEITKKLIMIKNVKISIVN